MDDGIAENTQLVIQRVVRSVTHLLGLWTLTSNPQSPARELVRLLLITEALAQLADGALSLGNLFGRLDKPVL